MQALITAAGGDENAYIRAPYGNANKTVKSVVTAPLIYWSVDPEDWKYRNAETVRSNIESGVFDGAIILVHDIYKTSVDGALAAIDDLMAEGYEFVTVKDLLLRRGVTPRRRRFITRQRTTASICLPTPSGSRRSTRAKSRRIGATLP